MKLELRDSDHCPFDFYDFQLFLDGFRDFLVRGRVQERKNSFVQSPRKRLSLALLFGKGLVL